MIRQLILRGEYPAQFVADGELGDATEDKILHTNFPRASRFQQLSRQLVDRSVMTTDSGDKLMMDQSTGRFDYRGSGLPSDQPEATGGSRCAHDQRGGGEEGLGCCSEAGQGNSDTECLGVRRSEAGRRWWAENGEVCPSRTPLEG
ncbi:Translation initiation factor 3 subunit c [Perkinsus olseni]|uniref:Translation initiation factor 3 subunit c n=1 Tax=Perkinsus olseni TaxID=32597 RepID=A0A7J6P076_PEROL|nr:Translation initiation factor 3 subunit c [Perkinsus olseni]